MSKQTLTINVDLFGYFPDSMFVKLIPSWLFPQRFGMEIDKKSSFPSRIS